MSGGVDSAVALLAAGRERGRRHAPALDRPGRRRDAERACCSPAAVIAARRDLPRARPPARDARPARGVPPRGRRAVRRGYARGETPNPCIRCNGSFRFDELLAFADRIGAARLATGHYARIVERDGAAAARPRRRRAQGPELHARDASTRRALDRLWFPLGGQTKEETRARGRGRRPRAPRGAPRARRRASSAATTTAPSSARHGLAAAAGPDRRRGRGAGSGRHDGFWRFTPGQRRGLGVAAAEPLYALGTDAATNTVVVGPRASLARTRVVGARAASTRRRAASRRSSATARPRSRRPSTATAGGFELAPRRARLRRRAAGRPPSSTTDDAVVGSGVITSATAD